MPGELLRIRNVKQFDQVLARVSQRISQSPAAVHAEAIPGFLPDVSMSEGPWDGRTEERFEIPITSETGRAIARGERTHGGEYDVLHVVAKHGFEIAGKYQEVRPDDFGYGGMTAEKAADLARRPVRDWNRTVNEILMDVFTQGAFSDSNDNPTEGFAYSVNDQRGNSISKQQISESSEEVADVVAHSGQSVNWPLRDGTTTGTGHDHVETAAGSSWTLADGRTARDHITEHPGMGANVDSIVGANTAADIRSVAKTERGAVESRVPFIEEGDVDGGDFANVQPIARLEGVDYFYSPDIPDNISVYYATDAQVPPMYYSIGANNSQGDRMASQQWVEDLGETSGGELQGRRYGFRDDFNAGIANPIGIYVQENTA